MKDILGVKDYKDSNGEDRSYWTRIGTAFENRDGSLNLKFDYFPTDPDMTIQVREKQEKKDEPPPSNKGKSRR